MTRDDLVPLARDRARLRRAALRITRDPAAADDAVQSGFEKALRHAAGFRGEAKPSTWLHRIVVNEALAWRRGEGRRARTVAAVAQAEPPAEAPQPLDALLRGEQRARVLRGLSALRAAERELLVGFALDGSYESAARAVGATRAATKARAFRARRALRAALAERGERWAAFAPARSSAGTSAPDRRRASTRREGSAD